MKVMYVSTAAGNPSTLWQSESGKYYRTKKQALADKGETINPNDVEIKTNTLSKRSNTIICCIISAVIATLITLYFVNKK